MKSVDRFFPGALLRGVRLHTALLLERRLGLFLALDAVLVLWSAWNGLVAGGSRQALYTWMTTAPCLLIGAPALAHLVAVERQAGTLDLALSTASVERYFLRRVLGVGGLLAVQGCAVALMTARGAVLPAAIVQSLALVVVTLAVTAFWALRLRDAGTALAASWITLLGVVVWLSGDCFAVVSGRAVDIVPWVAEMVAVAVAVALVVADIRLRLRHPQLLL